MSIESVSIESTRAELAAFMEKVRSGAVHYHPATARDCARHYDRLGAILLRHKATLAELEELGGFGGFDSARQLRAGFARKAAEAHQLLDHFIAAAEQMRAAFLMSGGLLAEETTA
jgi:hypothetical protein